MNQKNHNSINCTIAQKIGDLFYSDRQDEQRARGTRQSACIMMSIKLIYRP